jgi:hypothetical protein
MVSGGGGRMMRAKIRRPLFGFKSKKYVVGYVALVSGVACARRRRSLC